MWMGLQVLEDDQLLRRGVLGLDLVGDGYAIVFGVTGENVGIIRSFGWNAYGLELALLLCM